MAKRMVKTSKTPASPPSDSRGVVAAGSVLVSGQGPFDPSSGEIVDTTIREQVAQCLRNLAAILDASGSSLAKVVSATFILAEEADFPGLNEEQLKWFPREPPARQGAKLPIRPNGMKVSIAAIAEA
jgi:2-iminobutanoate/2-iminopropanoate deaminase